MNTDKICVFTDKGRMHTVKVMDIPYGKMKDKGTPIDNVSNFVSSDEQMVYVASLEEVKASTLFFASAAGMLKLVKGEEFDVSKRTIAATKLGEQDRLVLVQAADAMEYVVLQTKNGYFLRFLKNEVPEKKKTAIGVRGIHLGDKDEVEHAYLLENKMDYTTEYKGKNVTLNRLKLAKRDSKGTKARV